MKTGNDRYLLSQVADNALRITEDLESIKFLLSGETLQVNDEPLTERELPSFTLKGIIAEQVKSLDLLEGFKAVIKEPSND